MTETPQGHELFHQARERIQRGMVERCIPSLTVAVAKGNVAVSLFSKSSERSTVAIIIRTVAQFVFILLLH